MNICDRCIHADVCKKEETLDESLSYCCYFFGWIPVSEDLPKENMTVIASTEYVVYPEARYTKENGWEWAYESGADYWSELEDVTAWMPLPKLYKSHERRDKE